MPDRHYLQGPCAWRGAALSRSQRWIKAFPPALLAGIDIALASVGTLPWRAAMVIRRRGARCIPTNGVGSSSPARR